MNTITAWVPAIVAIVAMVANAAVLQSTVNRMERVVDDLREDVQELKTAVAVLRSRGGGAT